MNNQLIQRRLPLLTATMADQTAAAPKMTPVSIEREQKWLEGLVLNLSLSVASGTYTAIGTATEASLLGFANLAKDIRLTINDTTVRDVIRTNGAAAIELAARERVNLTSDTLDCIVTKDFADLTAAVYNLRIPIWLAPPSVEDPGGAYFGIPLAGLKQNPILSITWDRLATFFAAAGAVTLTAEAELYLRDVKDKDPLYLPSEIQTERFAWVATGKRRYELPEGGFLVSLLGQSFNSTPARSHPMNAITDEWSLYHGTVPVFNKSAFGAHLAAEEECNQTVARGGTGLWPANSTLFQNFIADRPDAGAFALTSALNMNLLAGGGDKVYVEASNIGNAGNVTYFTRRVIRGTSYGGILGL